MELREKLNVLIVLWFRCHLVTVASPFSPFQFLKIWRRKVQVVRDVTQALNVPRLLNLGLLNLGFLSLGQILFSFD